MYLTKYNSITRGFIYSCWHFLRCPDLLYIQCILAGGFSDKWKETIIVHVPKVPVTGTLQQNLKNFQFISLLNILREIFESLVLKYLRQIHFRLRNEQHVFKK